MQTQPYYKLAPEIQDYIRVVLIAVSTFGREDAEFFEQELQKTVFPRVPKKPQQAVSNMASVSSPQTASQMGEQFDSLDERRAVMDDAKPILSNSARMGGV